MPRGRTYEEVVAAFRWRIPESFNIGVACSDAQVAGDPAVIEYDAAGAHGCRTFGELAEASNRLANALVGLGVAPRRARRRCSCRRASRPRSRISRSQGRRRRAAAERALRARRAASPPGRQRRARADRRGRPRRRRRRARGRARARPSSSTARRRRRIAASTSCSRDASPAAPGIATAADEPAFLIYTSGTTAEPKGVLHAHRVALRPPARLRALAQLLPGRGDVFWTPADWAWIGGLMDALVPTLYLGRPIVAGPRGRFDPERAARVIARPACATRSSRRRRCG